MENNIQRILEGLDIQILDMMKKWNLPGLSLGIVKDGEVILAKGYGNRDEEQKLPMTEQTVLPIGSTTKSFTSLLLGMLVDEGKLEWDRPVKEYIPWLKLYDPMVTERVTARDLLCHRTGLPSHDVHGVFCAKDDRREMVEGLRYLQPNRDFRTKLQYQNQMVMLAGYLAEELTGKTWEELIKERILEPLGMNRTCTTIGEMEGYEEKSKGYLFNGSTNMETPYLSLRGVGPAGAVNSTAADMTQYLLFQLGNGTWKDRRLVSSENLEEMHTAQMLGSPYFWKMDEITCANYGLGWFVDRYRGQRMLSHGGNTLGFSSLMTLLPDHNFGMIALSNSNSNFMIYALTYALLDKMLGVEAEDWTVKLQTELGKVFGQMGEAAQARAKARIPDTVPSHSTEDYSGTYIHPAFGTFMLSVEGGELKGNFNGYDMIISHYHYDIFDVTLTLMGLSFPVVFQTGMDGKISGLSAVVEPTVDPVIFVKESIS